MNIDGMKHQMVMDFERWYSEEFEVSAEQMQQQMLQNTIATYQGETTKGGDDQQDDEAEAYLKAKRNVDNLHRAKKLERMRPGGYKK